MNGLLDQSKHIFSFVTRTNYQRRRLHCSPTDHNDWPILELSRSRTALTIPILGDILRDHRPDVVFLSETKGTSYDVELMKSRWKLHGISVDKIGQSGGLALLWKKDVEVQIKSFSSHHIDCTIFVQGSTQEIRITGFYGWPEVAQ